MAEFIKINTLQIGNHVWVFTEPQIIEWERDKESVTMRAVLRVHHEEYITENLLDLSKLSATDGEVTEQIEE